MKSVYSAVRTEPLNKAACAPSFKGRYVYFVCLLTYLRTYLLTPWSTVLIEKPIDFQLVKKFLAFYGTRKFITAFTSVRHLRVLSVFLVRFAM
jgi:hypothetical protein